MRRNFKQVRVAQWTIKRTIILSNFVGNVNMKFLSLLKSLRYIANIYILSSKFCIQTFLRDFVGFVHSVSDWSVEHRGPTTPPHTPVPVLKISRATKNLTADPLMVACLLYKIIEPRFKASWGWQGSGETYIPPGYQSFYAIPTMLFFSRLHP